MLFLLPTLIRTFFPDLHMNRHSSRIQLSLQDRQILTIPATAIAMLLSVVMLVRSFDAALPPSQRQLYLILGMASSVYIIFLYRWVLPVIDRNNVLNWVIVGFNGVCSGVLFVVDPDEAAILPLLFSMIVVVISAILTGRMATYAFILICTALQASLIQPGESVQHSLVLQISSLPLLGIIITETILRLQDALRKQMRRLETLNQVARSLATSLETPQVLALLNSAIQYSFKADTYYMGTLKGETLRLELFFDDGEFFSPVELSLENTMAGWAIHHQQSLLVHNFDHEAAKLGIESVIVGKSKGSLSWMGTPISSGGGQLGLVAVASYKPNAFSQVDLELLENIAQQAALALDNTYHHAAVEAQSRSDSLTGVYNHGYFLKILEREAEKTLQEQSQLSLIMLDIDHFKHYNDTYGHLAGDEILSLLTSNIQRHIHATDSVGRWGGEEFVILLPETTGEHAAVVAERIRQSMNTFIISRRDQQSIPSPTVSQGIAVYPDEANDIFALIDLADQRLYLAKERGRNQIEAVPLVFEKHPIDAPIAAD
jgi:diguanylate cyclase (GGDEF)-like protein